METTLYFKDIRNKDQNNYPSKIYKVEYCRMLIEVLDTEHINGRPHYFGSPRLRDEFINNMKDYILRINSEELSKIQSYWKKIKLILSNEKVTIKRSHFLFLILCNYFRKCN